MQAYIFFSVIVLRDPVHMGLNTFMLRKNKGRLFFSIGNRKRKVVPGRTAPPRFRPAPPRLVSPHSAPTRLAPPRLAAPVGCLDLGPDKQ